MVQNISNQNPNAYGAINRIGMTENGRIVYQVIDGNGQAAGKMSIPPNQADVFEKSYRDLLESAPKLQKYAETTSPEKMQKQQTASKWIVGICTAVGLLIPAIKAKGSLLKQLGLSFLGGAAGIATGIGIAYATTTPPGATKFAKATKNISKLDIQVVNE